MTKKFIKIITITSTAKEVSLHPLAHVDEAHIYIYFFSFGEGDVQ